MNKPLLALAIAFTFSAFARAADPEDLLPLFPTEVNSMAVINVAGILASPRAVKEGWTNLNHTEYLAGAIPVNPSVERIMLAKEYVPSQPNKNWPMTLIPLKNQVNLEKFAKAYQGEMISVADTSAVLIGHDKYAAAVKPNLLGLLQASNKQEISRWVRYAKDASSSKQPGYINAAVRAHGKSHHIMVALATSDLLDEQNVGLAVALSKVLEGAEKAAAAKEIQTFFAKMRGLRAMIMVRDTGITIDLYLESVIATKPDPELLKAFVIEWMGNYGAQLEDMPAATVAINEGIVHLGFKMSDPELAHVMALFLPPLANVGEENTLTVTPGGVSVDGSGRYYRAVNKIIDDLSKQSAKLKNPTAEEYKKSSLWYETAALKIETLSILGVDKDVVTYAQGTASRLRMIGDSLKGVPVKADALTAQSYAYRYTSASMYFNGRGFRPIVGFNTTSNYNEIQNEINQVVAKDEDSRKQLWASIERERSNVRQAMAEKYKDDFDTPQKPKR